MQIFSRGVHLCSIESTCSNCFARCDDRLSFIDLCRPAAAAGQKEPQPDSEQSESEYEQFQYEHNAQQPGAPSQTETLARPKPIYAGRPNRTMV